MDEQVAQHGTSNVSSCDLIVTQKQICNKEFEVIHQKLIELQDSVKALRNFAIGQITAFALTLLTYILQQI